MPNLSFYDFFVNFIVHYTVEQFQPNLNMKKIVVLSVLLLTAGLMSFVQSKVYVSVSDYTRAEEVKPDRRGRAEFEVIIHRIARPAPGYNIYLYRTQNGKFTSYQFNRPGTTAFTEAMVAWRNDSTVAIRLQSGTNEQDYFALQCSGTNIALWTETK